MAGTPMIIQTQSGRKVWLKTETRDWHLTEDHRGERCRVFCNDTQQWHSAVVVGLDEAQQVFFLGKSGLADWPMTPVRTNDGKHLVVNPMQLIFED